MNFELKKKGDTMSKRNKFKNENQYQLDFQVGSESFPQNRLNSLDQFVGADKVQLRKTAQFVEFDKAGLSEKAQSARAFKVKASQKSQSKGLSKKDTETKIKDIACGDKKAVGLFFDNLITVEELAVVFGLAPQTIRNWVAQGKLPYVKIGKRNMFLTGSLQEWLNQKEEPQWQ